MHSAHAFIQSLTCAWHFITSWIQLQWNATIHFKISPCHYSLFLIFTSFTTVVFIPKPHGLMHSLFGNYRCFRDVVIPKQLEWAVLPAGSRMCSTVALNPTVQKRGRPRQLAPAWTDWWVGGSVGSREWAMVTFAGQTWENAALGKALVVLDTQFFL